MNDDPRTPELAEVLDIASRGAIYGLRVMLPGRVESYDAATHRCSVTPLIMDGDELESGEPIAVALPVLCDVPVAFFGAGAFSITCPLKKGDEVMLVFSSSSISQLKSLHRRGSRPLAPVDPGDDRRHDINDAYAIPVRAITLVPNQATEQNALVIQGPDVRLGGPNASGTGNRVAMRSDLQALKNAIAGAPTTGGDGGAAFKAGILDALEDWPTCAAKVRVE